MTVCSCGDSEEQVNWSFAEKAALLVQEDGWVYSFTYTFNKEAGDEDDGLLPYNFFGVNLRYRYNEDYMTTISTMENGEMVTKTVPQTIQMLGLSNSLAQQNDMNKIAEILKYNGGTVTNEDLLALTPENLDFEELDEELFLGLVQQALSAENHDEGNYVDLPYYALLTEPEYLDDYKFQIGLIADMGCVDVIFIDVLFRTGSGYADYVQLSDLVESGEANDEQITAYENIQKLEEGIVDENDLMFGKDENESVSIGSIEFSRLYQFLKNLEEGNYYQYVIEP
ncbi:MAG: hypothetical protein LUE29_13820 [Lachnospiraceae bacterium]|nr:hypothetical protein [Lachnospiraceae bacterium]